MGIGAKPEGRAGSLGDNFRPGPGHRGEQPGKATLARYEFDFPDAVQADKFIVPFRDTQDFVHGLDPFPGNPVFSEHDGGENLAQGGAEPLGLQEQCFRSLRVGLRQCQKLGAALGGNNARRLQKVDEASPGQFCVR